ncbi:MAG: DoxX-like family protein [Ktedonobacterales bacterium]
MGIYVETFIHGSMEELWQRTQTPELHEQWDLRFSHITYLPRPDPAEPQRFLYETRIGFGLAIRGKGESVGDKAQAGRRTSALTFWSDDPRSIIRKGSGYWQYVQHEQGVQFLTWYDYSTRFGLVGKVFDRAIFRPLMGWATAWSFDRLRLWIERGIDPATARRNASMHAVARIVLAFIWLYHGLVPKVLLTQHDEVVMLLAGGISPASAHLAVRVLGLAEVAFGVLLLVTWRQRWPFVATVVLMLLATAGVALTAPQYLGAAFNPVTLNVAVIALALIGVLASGGSPFASRCLRRRRTHQEQNA